MQSELVLDEVGSEGSRPVLTQDAKTEGHGSDMHLSSEELWQLYRSAAEDPDCDPARLEALRNRLIETYYPLVKHIAVRLSQTLPRSIEVDDLVSAGVLGLMDSIRRFDQERGVKFKTFCMTRIRGSILDQLRSQDWVPRLVRIKAARIRKVILRLSGELRREPTHAELAKELDLDQEGLTREMLGSSAVAVFSLSDAWEEDDGGSAELFSAIENTGARDPLAEMQRKDWMRYMTRSLTHKERFIIHQYYEVGHTMNEIGQMLGLTESRVCQIHSNVMGRLRALLREHVESSGLDQGGGE